MKIPRSARSRLLRVAVPAAALGLALPLVLATPAAAQGGTAVRYGSYVVYQAAEGEENDVTVTSVTGLLVIHDEAGADAGPGCTQVDDETVHCGQVSGVSRLTVQLRDEDDDLSVQVAVNTTVDAGSGEDTVATAGGNDQINLRDGAGGDVVTTCGTGFDYVSANPGDTVPANVGCEYRAFS
ncbi:hypothetical protein ACFPM3_27400 [Streptomyces coeruleoprunus]|uniref:Uncharacterized protein n=1 Tax=Streptomyces coeruleoprunus TaxID=285563 RepID=A0ABV9XKD5_9ACTN